MSASADINLPNKEETDLLARSNKKVKFVSEREDPGDGQHVDEEGDSREHSERRKTSYREMVLVSNMDAGTNENSSYPDNVEDVSDDEQVDESALNDPDCPTIPVSKHEKRSMRSRWSKALIVKLIGHTVGFNFLSRRLKALWHIQSHIDVIDVGHDVYVIRFENQDEYDRALFEGPWIIADHYLAVCKWYHDFEPAFFSVSRLAVWVRIPNIPMEYYYEDFIRKIGHRIGNPLRVDLTTVAAVRGRFARLCVEVDLTKRLLSKFILRKKVRKIEYEGMHIICYDCGMYGHRREECVLRSKKPDACLDGQVPPPPEKPMKEAAPEEKDTYGNWMLVKKAPRKKGKVLTKENIQEKNQAKNKDSVKESKGQIQTVNKKNMLGQTGSSFFVLNELSGEEFWEEKSDEIEEHSFPSTKEKFQQKKMFKGSTSRPMPNKGENKVGGVKNSNGKEVVRKKTHSLTSKNNNVQSLKETEKKKQGIIIRDINDAPKKSTKSTVAADMDYHVLVRGNNNDKNITRSTISNPVLGCEEGTLDPERGTVPYQPTSSDNDGMQLSSEEEEVENDDMEEDENHSIIPESDMDMSSLGVSETPTF